MLFKLILKLSSSTVSVMIAPLSCFYFCSASLTFHSITEELSKSANCQQMSSDVPTHVDHLHPPAAVHIPILLPPADTPVSHYRINPLLYISSLPALSLCQLTMFGVL